MVMSPKRKRIPPRRVYVSYMVVNRRQGKVMDDMVACHVHFGVLLVSCVLSYDGPVCYGSGARHHVVGWCWRGMVEGWEILSRPAGFAQGLRDSYSAAVPTIPSTSSRQSARKSASAFVRHIGGLIL